MFEQDAEADSASRPTTMEDRLESTEQADGLRRQRAAKWLVIDRWGATTRLDDTAVWLEGSRTLLGAVCGICHRVATSQRVS